MSCVNFTRRSRCNSSSRCCYRASGHVDPACSRDNPLVKHSGAYITLPSLRYVNVRRHVTRAYVQTMTGTREFSWRRTRGGVISMKRAARRARTGRTYSRTHPPWLGCTTPPIRPLAGAARTNTCRSALAATAPATTGERFS